MKHHPDESLLLAQAVGALDDAAALVVGAHLETCAQCRQSAVMLDAVGGVLFNEIDPVAVDSGAFSRTLERIDARQAASKQTPVHRFRPDIPAGMHWPRSLEHCDISPWKWIGPGMRWSRIRIPGNPNANAFLLRMGAGMTLADHTHDGRELTQILLGAFADGRSTWRAGDLDETDQSVQHRPIVTDDSECICLVAVDGRVRFKGLLARALGAWMGI